VKAKRNLTVPEALQLVQVLVEMRRKERRPVSGNGGLPANHVEEHEALPGWNFQRGIADKDLPRDSAKRGSECCSAFSSCRGELNRTTHSTEYL